MKTRILLVDDDFSSRELMADIFKQNEYDTYTAENGMEALRIIRDNEPDIVVSDLFMPEMDGMEFLKVLRSLDGGDKPIVIFCTTENDMSFIQEAIANGANEFVMKPFDQGIIEGKLREVGLL